MSERDPFGTPGEEGIWMFVLADLFVFSLFFLTFLYYRGLNVELFQRSQISLLHELGVANTLVLITSSWWAACGVRAMRERSLAAANQWFRRTAVLGCVFVAIKCYEFYHQAALGHGVTTNDFYMFYFVFGGIHLLHVVVGVVVLLVFAGGLRGPVLSSRGATSIESGVIYWHLVDVLWVVLFTLFYLLV